MNEPNTISSTSNPLILKLSKLSKKEEIISQQRFLIENENILQEALKTGNLEMILTTNLLSHSNFENKILVNQKIINKLKQTVNNSGIIGICKIPNNIKINIISKEFKKIIVLDNLNDPGNLGTIIRNALAFDFDAIVLTNNCVDLFNPKLIRSTQGAIFLFPIIILDEQHTFLLNDYFLYLFELSLKATKIRTLNSNPDFPFALVFGNEANGLDLKRYEKFNIESIYIPIKNIDSLNVASAAAIAFFYFQS